MTIKDFPLTLAPVGFIDGPAIVSASFEEWITHVFDHPPNPGHWRWKEDYIHWAAPADQTTFFLTKTFEESGTLLKRFSDQQVNDGLWYIFSESLSGISNALRDESVPATKRKQAIYSMRSLYTDCFAVRCAPFLSHVEKNDDEHPLTNILNSACFMWWDFNRIEFQLNHSLPNEIDVQCLAVMEFALGLKSDACRESGLHGLGHWAKLYPEFVQSTIDRFLQVNPNANPQLIAYALNAREGKVL